MATSAKRPKPSTCRMFDTPVIELFSRIHPASPFVFWVPVLALLCAWDLWQGMGVLTLLGLFGTGMLAWTLVEYLLHRYVFHYIGPVWWKRRMYFILHGVHHDYPQDFKRLVMPLGISIPLGVAFFLLVDLFAVRPVAVALFCGFAGGYLCYDGIHFATHHVKARTRVGKYLKRYHMVHHFTGLEGMWGVSSPLWDFVFRTETDQRKKAPAADRHADATS